MEITYNPHIPIKRFGDTGECDKYIKPALELLRKLEVEKTLSNTLIPDSVKDAVRRRHLAPGVFVECFTGLAGSHINIHVTDEHHKRQLSVEEIEETQEELKKGIAGLIHSRYSVRFYDTALEYNYFENHEELAVPKASYLSSNYSFTPCPIAVGVGGIGGLSQVRYTVDDKIASIIHYTEQPAWDTASFNMVTEVVGEKNMPSLKIAVSTENAEIYMEGAFSADLNTFYYVESGYLSILGNRHINTNISRRVYSRIDTDGVLSWSLISTEAIPYTASDLYWVDTTIDSNGNVGTFFLPEERESINEIVMDPYADGNFEPARWPGEQNITIRYGTFDEEGVTYYKKYTLAGAFANSEQTLSSVVNNYNFVTLSPLTSDGGPGWHRTSDSTGWVDSMGDYTYAVAGAYGWKNEKYGDKLTWSILGRSILSFSAGYSEEQASVEAEQYPGGGGYTDKDSASKDVSGTATIVNHTKTAITLQSNYAEVIKEGTLYQSYDPPLYAVYPTGGAYNDWYTFQAIIFEAPVISSETINRTDLVFPIYDEGILSLGDSFYCADTALKLSIYGVKYQGGSESSETWKIFVEQNGAFLDVSNMFRQHYKGQLYILTESGERVTRTEADMLTDLDNRFSCCYLKASYLDEVLDADN